MTKATFQKYLELRYSPNTIKQYLWAYESFADRLQDQDEIDRFLIKKCYSRGHNPFYIGFLKSYLDCFQLPFIVTRSKKKGRNEAKEYKFLTKQEVDNIVNNTSPYISLLVRLYFETGLRLRELINVHWNNIDLQNRTLGGIGKGNRPFIAKYSKKAALKLQDYLDLNMRGYPFHTDDTDKDHAYCFYYHLKKECESIGIEDIHPHRFRHALGHHLRVDKGFDLPQIQVKLRHVKLETTGIYTTATQKEVDDKVDKEVFGE